MSQCTIIILNLAGNVKENLNKFRGDLWHDGIAVPPDRHTTPYHLPGAQRDQAAGYPMSQRGNSGFNPTCDAPGICNELRA